MKLSNVSADLRTSLFHLRRTFDDKRPTQVEYVSSRHPSAQKHTRQYRDRMLSFIHSWQNVHLESWLNSWTETNKAASKLYLFSFRFFYISLTNFILIEITSIVSNILISETFLAVHQINLAFDTFYCFVFF